MFFLFIFFIIFLFCLIELAPLIFLIYNMMKKIGFFKIFCLGLIISQIILLLIIVTPLISPNISTRREPLEQSSVDNSNSTPLPSERIVYITKTGEKYHQIGCRYLKYSSIPITLSEAISRGYTPCSICKP